MYLDSSDFSCLSHPSATPEIKSTRDRLIDLATLPSVRFVFSGAHLSEMAPLEARHTHFAAARTDLLVLLCKRNCLISFDRLVMAETERLEAHGLQTVAAIVDDGTWFPDVGQIVTPAQALDPIKALDDKAHELGLNRKQRRLLKSKTVKSGKIRQGTLENAAAASLDEILSIYPMRREDAQTLTQYVLGNLGAERADHAFLESLRDPRWMMRWFQEHYDRLGVIGDWVRRPARKLSDQMASVAATTARALQYEQLTGQNILGDQLTRSGWSRAQDDLLLDVVNHVAKPQLMGKSPCTDAAIVDTYCPGISMCIRVTHSSLRKAIGNSARTPEPNDFVDAVHSMYAPYVDIFRSDRYMSPIISEHASKYGTQVIAKLQDVPEKIESALATSCRSSVGRADP